MYGIIKAAGFARTAKTFLHGGVHNEAHKFLHEKGEDLLGAENDQPKDVMELLRSKTTGNVAGSVPRDIIPGDFSRGAQMRMIGGRPVYVPANIAAILNRSVASGGVDNHPGYM